MADQPNLGYGKPTEASIDTVNIWMRGQPWYQTLMAQWGQDPGHPTLTKAQSQQVLKAAQGQGVVVDEGDMEVDDHGNFNPKGHKLRNTLIVAGLAGASLATMGLAGAFGGAGAAGAAGAETAGLGSTGGVLAGLPGAGTALGGAGAAGAVLPSVGGLTIGALPAGAVPTGMAGGAAIPGASTFAGAGTALAPGGSTYDKINNLLAAGGKAVGAATDAAGQNRLNQENLGLTANNQNIQGQSAFENELMKRATTEAEQRHNALKDVYRASYAKNQPVNPYNPSGRPAMSPEYLATLGNLEAQGGKKLATGAQYDTNGMPVLVPYNPLDIKNVPGSTGTQKGTLETIGDWLSPGMSIFSAASQLRK